VSRVHVPTPLRSYTGERAEVEADGTTVAQLLDDLDRRFPGIRFRMIDEQDRIRQHIRLFVDGEMVSEISHPIRPGEEIQILCALSGG
jgi:sulfur-carrier protein